MLPTFTFARAVSSLWSICLGVNVLSHFAYFALCLTSDDIEE